jgi:tetratricopeptide (TPR) repeat protein
MLQDLGRYSEAREGFLRCVSPDGKAPNLISQTNCLAGLASVSLDLGDVAAAKRALTDAVTFVGNAVEPGSPEMVALQTLRGRVALAEREFGRARTNLDAAIDVGKSQSQLHKALLIRADLDLQEGDAARAEADARRALSLAQTLQGALPYSNNTGLAWLALGEALRRQEDVAGARQAFHSAVAQLSRTVDDSHPMLQRARERERG